MVAKEFEESDKRLEAGTYDGYVTVLGSVMRQHMVQNGTSSRTKRNLWWDEEVAEAWRVRRQANRDHCQALKAMDVDELLPHGNITSS